MTVWVKTASGEDISFQLSRGQNNRFELRTWATFACILTEILHRVRTVLSDPSVRYIAQPPDHGHWTEQGRLYSGDAVPEQQLATLQVEIRIQGGRPRMLLRIFPHRADIEAVFDAYRDAPPRRRHSRR